MKIFLTGWSVVLCSLVANNPGLNAQAELPESYWLEAEHFAGIEGYCWPLGDETREMTKTNGHWGLSGPGWAAEWNQGGESGFMSIAVGPEENSAVVRCSVQIPAAAKYFVWVRYSDWREQTEQFEIKIIQESKSEQLLSFGTKSAVEEDNEMKLYWGWAFAWDQRAVELEAGAAEIQLVASQAQTVPRQIDAVALTTDSNYSPLTKDQPANESNQYLKALRENGKGDLKPLARRNLWGQISRDEWTTNAGTWNAPESWKINTFRDQGFIYLWNVSHTDPLATWLSDNPRRVKFPHNIIDSETQAEFETMYGGKNDVPIFSDPRIVPAFHGVGAGVFATDETSGELTLLGEKFAGWLDQNPNRNWAMLLNYHPGKKIGPKGVATFEKFRERFVGSIAGESLGYFYPTEEDMRAATNGATTRRQLVESFKGISLQANAEKYRAVYDRDLDANPFADVISCHSVGSMAFAPICFEWGAKTVGYESSAATASLLSLRLACMRGAARQHDGMTATYRSCNFGDASTIFSQVSSFAGPQFILDNYYSVYSGAGMTWYKFDIWYQYMAGSSMFYHEQGFDEFWKPGGTTAAGKKPVQLSPKGKLVDRFLRVTTEHPNRGAPVTPVAFLLDYANGWEPSSFWPNSFVNWHKQPDRFLHSNHEQMLQQWLWAAYYPIGPQSEKPMTAINEVYVAGIFGDMFDCVFTYPDVQKCQTFAGYPVMIALGEIELTAAEGKHLNEYVENGGTLLVSANQLSGPGAAELALPATSNLKTANSYSWDFQGNRQIPHQQISSSTFAYSPIELEGGTQSDMGWQNLARTSSDDCFCAYMDRGKGRIVVVTIPYGLTVTGRLHPICARLLTHLTRQQMPIEVEGEVEWLVNRDSDAWYLTLLNPAGQAKPQQGITPTDYSQNKQITIRTTFRFNAISDWLAPDEVFSVDSTDSQEIKLMVPAGGVRILEIK